MPMSYNAWLYAYANPITLTDPSGWYPFPEVPCHLLPPDEQDECRGWSDCRSKLHQGPPSIDPEIPSPQYFPCRNRDNGVCLSSSDDPITQITHTVFGEGGSLDRRTGANVLQTLLNRAYIYWHQPHAGINPNGRLWGQMNSEQLSALFLFILSEPYFGSDGNQYPSYNAWGAPYPHAGIYWKDIKLAVENLLKEPGVHPTQAPIVVGSGSTARYPLSSIRGNVNVIYYGAGSKGWIPEVPWVAVDKVPAGEELLWQYYGTFPINP